MPYEGLSSDGCFFSSVGEMWVVLARSLAWLDLDIPKTLPLNITCWLQNF